MLYNNYNEAIILLMETCKKAIPFNIILGFLLSLDLIYNGVPFLLVTSWFLGIILISFIRWSFCIQFTDKAFSEDITHSLLFKFNLLTFITGSLWSLCYFITLPYLSELHEFIIILVLGGMCAGSIASLSSSLATYYSYVIPMFLPVIVYNYLLFQTDRAILATMFSLFVVMLIVSAKITKKLLDDNFHLSYQKDSLIHDLQMLSITDSLTGLYNRRHFQFTLPHEINNAKLNKHSLNLISMDVDNFKLINDNFGHPNGDKFLIEVGLIIESICKHANGLLFRLGGDEFAAIFVDKSLKEALHVCELINHDFKENLNQHHYFMEESMLDQITLSMGIVNIHFKCALEMDNVITIVDNALYQAKKQGKNQIIVKHLH